MTTTADLLGSKSSEEEEHLKHLIDKVFSLEEVVENILKFVPAYEPLQDIFTLRKVCKLWRKACFNLMLKCDRFPIKVDLSDSEELTKFTSTFSPDCSIPISVKVEGEHWLLEQLNFLHDYSRNIVRVKFPTVPAKDVTIPEEKYQILLPRLRTVKVVSPPERMYHPPDSHAAEFIQEMTNKSRHIQLKEFVVQIGNKTSHSDTDSDYDKSDTSSSSASFFCAPEDDYLPANVTQLILTDQLLSCGYSTDFLSQAKLPNLRSLYFKSYENSPLCYPRDCEILPILSQHASNLVHLRFNLKVVCFSADGESVLKIPKFPMLETLKLRDLRIASENDSEPLSDYLPKLRSFGNLDMYQTETFPTLLNLSAWNPQHENLKELTMQLTQRRAKDGFHYKKCLTKIVNTLENFFNTCSNLETLSVSFSGVSVASVVLNRAFEQLNNLRDLKITIHKGGTFRAFYGLLLPEKNQNACYLLTGLKQDEIPEDRDSWKGLLEGNQKSISNLKQLRNLSLEYNHNFERNLKLVPFVLYALLEMPNLKRIRFEGTIKVEENFAETWRSQRRFISFPGIEEDCESDGESDQEEDGSDVKSEQELDSSDAETGEGEDDSGEFQPSNPRRFFFQY